MRKSALLSAESTDLEVELTQSESTESTSHVKSSVRPLEVEFHS